MRLCVLFSCFVTKTASWTLLKIDTGCLHHKVSEFDMFAVISVVE